MRWMHYYRANKYVLTRRLKQSVLLVGSRIKSGGEFQASGPATENARRPLSVEPHNNRQAAIVDIRLRFAAAVHSNL